MPVIFETEEFIVKAHDDPHHSRENGGHIVITPKQKYAHPHEMPVKLANEMMQWTMVLGEAITTTMTKAGLNVVRINYQDNGNWAYKEPNPEPQVHVHLYVRTLHERHPDNNPRFQAFPEALFFPDRSTGYYEKFVGLTEEERKSVKNEVEKLLALDKYKNLKLK